MKVSGRDFPMRPGLAANHCGILSGTKDRAFEDYTCHGEMLRRPQSQIKGWLGRRKIAQIESVNRDCKDLSEGW